MENMNVELSVVVPIYNEEESIPELYNRLHASVKQVTNEYEMIFINDGSRDKSLLKLMELSRQDSRVYFINFSRNFGHQIAVTAGLDHSRGNAVVIIDADLQDPPEIIPELYKKHKEGYEVVFAQRKKRAGESAFKKLTARVFYRLLKRMTSINIPVDTGDFRLVDKKIIEYLRKMPEQNKFLRGQISWLGFRQVAVEYNRDSRKYGTTGYPFRKMLRFAMDGITSFSDKPLSFVTKLGLVVSIISFVYATIIIYSHFIGGKAVPGWASILVSTMLFGGIQLISVGIIGIYIARINKNINNRPLYIIESKNI